MKPICAIALALLLGALPATAQLLYPDSVEPVTDLPVILLWGADERVLALGQAEEIRGKVPTAEVVIRGGWDHFPMIEQPEEYAREIVAMADRLRSG